MLLTRLKVTPDTGYMTNISAYAGAQWQYGKLETIATKRGPARRAHESLWGPLDRIRIGTSGRFGSVAEPVAELGLLFPSHLGQPLQFPSIWNVLDSRRRSNAFADIAWGTDHISRSHVHIPPKNKNRSRSVFYVHILRAMTTCIISAFTIIL